MNKTYYTMEFLEAFEKAGYPIYLMVSRFMFLKFFYVYVTPTTYDVLKQELEDPYI